MASAGPDFSTENPAWDRNGIDGIFLELHNIPAEAKSDGDNSLHLNHLLEQLLAIHAAAKTTS